MKNLTYEIKLACLSLIRVPGFATTVITTLAITLGALICIFNLNTVLLTKALPYPDADNLTVLTHSYKQDGEVNHHWGQAMPGLMLSYKQQTVMSEMAVLIYGKKILENHPQQPSIRVNYVTHEYFSLLQPNMHLGREMTAAEGLNTHQAVAVISYETWRNWFNSNRAIIGLKTKIGDVSYKIIGVTAKDFYEPQVTGTNPIEVWLPWDFEPRKITEWDNRVGYLLSIGRLKDNITPAQAASSLSKQINEQFITADTTQSGDTITAKLTPLKQKITGDSQRIALLLFSGVLSLLLIAITNVTNLFLSRAAEKQRTMAIQAALGAKPSHLFTAMFAEGIVLCTLAGLFGLIIASWGFVLLSELAAQQLPRIAELGLDAVTFFFTTMTILILAAILAKLSSRVVDYDNLKNQLQSSGKGSGLQISSRIRNFLITTQVTLATLLMIGVTVVIKQAIGTITHPLGYNEQQLYHLELDEPKDYLKSSERMLLSLQIKEKLKQFPQVKDVTRSLLAPIFSGSWTRGISDAEQQRAGVHHWNSIDANYFNLIELPIVKGRTFSAQINDAEQVTEMLVSESMAQYLSPNENIIGKFYFADGAEPQKVVGIVQDYYNPHQESVEGKVADFSRRYYLPFISMYLGFDIKLNENGDLNKQQMLSLLKEIDPNLKIKEFESQSITHQKIIYRYKLAAGLTILLAILALVLAGAGIFGIINYSTQMRRYQLGIHLALGAKTERVLNMVLKENFRPVLLGIGLSLLMAVVIYLIVRTQSVSSIEFDFTVLLIAIPIMLLVSYFACYFPVKKVITDDPVKALRNE